MYASDSQVDILSQNLLMANSSANGYGGALYLTMSNVTFYYSNSERAISCRTATSTKRAYLMIGNQANIGGAVYAIKSKLNIDTCSQATVNFSANLAKKNGGGLFLMLTEVMVRGHAVYVNNNEAVERGGGLYAHNSSIIVDGALNFIENRATRGGGVGLEKYAKFHGISHKNTSTVTFTSNRACNHGGALFIDDETNPEICNAITRQNRTFTTECFSKSIFFKFSDNRAGESGSNLFGGLLDRCQIHDESSLDSNRNCSLGLVSFLKSSNIIETDLNTISSYPVLLCFCRDNIPDCNYQPETVHIDKKESIFY